MILNLEFEETQSTLEATFNESQEVLNADFGEVHEIGNADGGYDKGFTDGKTEGEAAGYQKGYTEGESVGYENGKTDGIQTEYDRFWDRYQNKGRAIVMNQAFAGTRWDDITYNPKYTIKPVNINCLYQFTNITDTKVDIDLRSHPNNNKQNVFDSSMIVTVRKVILPDNTTEFTFPNWFVNAKYLKNITFEGGNICKSIDFSYSPLTVKTMKHIISRLENHRGTENEGVNSLKFKSTCWEELEADSTSPTGTTWKEYVNNLGWQT